MWTSLIHFSRMFALKSNENTLGQELWIIMVCNYKMICAHHNQLCKLGNYSKKKANQPWTKISTLVRCLHHFPPFSLQISYIYMFPKVASNAGCLPFWLPIFSKNGPISRCAEKLQFAMESVGPVAAQQISIEALKAWSAAGLLQPLWWLERTLTKRKGAKELKWLNLFLPLAVGCPKQQGNQCWRRSWMYSLNRDPAHPHPLLFLLPNLDPQGSNCSILFLLSNPRPKEAPCLCSRHRHASPFGTLSFLFGKYGW